MRYWINVCDGSLFPLKPFFLIKISARFFQKVTSLCQINGHFLLEYTYSHVKFKHFQNIYREKNSKNLFRLPTFRKGGAPFSRHSGYVGNCRSTTSYHNNVLQFVRKLLCIACNFEWNLGFKTVDLLLKCLSKLVS